MVFVGTNNEGLRDPKITGDKGVLMAFRESTASSCGRWSTTSSRRPRQRLAVPGRCFVAA
jgi:hypothetical protein